MTTFQGQRAFGSSAVFKMADIFGKQGATMLREFVDIDGDGQMEFICSVGNEAHVAAIDPTDMSIIWQNDQNTAKTQPCRYPKVAKSQNAIVLGQSTNDTLYCFDLDTGSLRWSRTFSDPLTEVDATGDGVWIKTYAEVSRANWSDGSDKSGWPVSFDSSSGGQGFSAGDIDNDGSDEVVACDGGDGVIKAWDGDGTILFSNTYDHEHNDLLTIGDIHPTHSANELLAVVDTTADGIGEGNEIMLLDAAGSEIEHWTGPSANLAHVTGDFYSSDGLEIVYSTENGDLIGMLNGDLTERWSIRVPDDKRQADSCGQLSAGDIDGDGELEILVNSTESAEAAVLAFNRDGSYLGSWQGHGWDFTPRAKRPTGSPKSMIFDDVDGDGRAEFHGSLIAHATNNEDETIYINNYQL